MPDMGSLLKTGCNNRSLACLPYQTQNLFCGTYCPI